MFNQEKDTLVSLGRFIFVVIIDQRPLGHYRLRLGRVLGGLWCWLGVDIKHAWCILFRNLCTPCLSASNFKLPLHSNCRVPTDLVSQYIHKVALLTSQDGIQDTLFRAPQDGHEPQGPDRKNGAPIGGCHLDSQVIIVSLALRRLLCSSRSSSIRLVVHWLSMQIRVQGQQPSHLCAASTPAQHTPKAA